jgi:serine/threonine protein kinase
VWYPIGELENNRSLAGCVFKKGHLSINEAKIILAQLVDTIAYLHRNGVSHGDIKPANILVDEALQVSER